MYGRLSLYLFTCCCPISMHVLGVLALSPLQQQHQQQRPRAPQESMTAVVQITSGGVEFQPLSPYSEVSSAVASLRYYPRESVLQKVRNLEIRGTPEPDAVLSNGSSDMPIDLLWEYPAAPFCNFQLSAVVETRRAVVPIRHKVPFPIVSSPDQVPAEYLRAGMMANRNTQIQRLAETLTAGHSDLYHAVVAIADWVTTHIRYHFMENSFHHEDTSQSATQVLQSGCGKCDEITALFVSLNRAVGIPARFVSGYLCSDNNNDSIDSSVRQGTPEDWIPHSWAEVWFPETGWVPFDVTEGEYGYLNAGHIMMSVSDDAQTTTVDYNGRGSDFDMLVSDVFDTFIGPKQMELSRKESATGAAAEQKVDISLRSSHPQVDFGATVEILATIQNPNDYYISTLLLFGDTPDTKLVNEADATRTVSLNPGEERTISYEVVFNPHLRRGNKYDFPFVVSTQCGQTAEHVVEVKDSQDHQQQAMNDYANQNETFATPRAPPRRQQLPPPFYPNSFAPIRNPSFWPRPPYNPGFNKNFGYLAPDHPLF